jgi:hypothetical protein
MRTLKILALATFSLAAASFGFTATADAQCTNTCSTAHDNECDDGGPNSLYSICTLGSDCADCGARGAVSLCTNTCSTSNDQECDDGGPNSLYSICDLGTDCNDCGARGGAPAAGVCTNT